jgi:transcriptional regulator with XRE-family HTH domain
MEHTPSFGYWLRRRRKALDLTQAALAQQVGCAAVTIRRIEADARRPSRQMAERLAECLLIAPTERSVFVEAARARLAVDRLVQLGLNTAIVSADWRLLTANACGSRQSAVASRANCGAISVALCYPKRPVI